MPRPKLPDSELKHPRKPRKSVSKGIRLEDYPKPSKAQIKSAQPLIDACIAAVLGQEVRALNVAKKKMLMLCLPKQWVRPDNWPKMIPVKTLENGDRVVKVNPEILLLWFYERFYTEFTPERLYKNRRSVLQSLTKIENSLDINRLLSI